MTVSTVPPARRPRGEGQWALGHREPLNPNERSKKDDNPLNVRARVENIYAHRGFASIDPADLRGRLRWYGRRRGRVLPGAQFPGLGRRLRFGRPGLRDRPGRGRRGRGGDAEKDRARPERLDGESGTRPDRKQTLYSRLACIRPHVRVQLIAALSQFQHVAKNQPVFAAQTGQCVDAGAQRTWIGVVGIVEKMRAIESRK